MDPSPQLRAHADASPSAVQPNVLSGRVQQMLQLVFRSNAKHLVLEGPTAFGVEKAQFPAQVCAKGHQPPDRLELQTAIVHHLEWCVLFNEHLSFKETGNASPVPLPSTANSGLGQWLLGARGVPASVGCCLDALFQEHQRFHQFAQRALALARQGRMDLASTLLNTDFERSRARILELLRQMQKESRPASAAV